MFNVVVSGEVKSEAIRPGDMKAGCWCVPVPRSSPLLYRPERGEYGHDLHVCGLYV